MFRVAYLGLLSQLKSRADPAFLIRMGSNSEIFLSGLRKLFKRGKFLYFQTFFKNVVLRVCMFHHSILIITSSWDSINQFIKTCFL